MSGCTIVAGSDMLTPPKLVPSKRPAGTATKEPNAKRTSFSTKLSSSSSVVELDCCAIHADA